MVTSLNKEFQTFEAAVVSFSLGSLRAILYWVVSPASQLTDVEHGLNGFKQLISSQVP